VTGPRRISAVVPTLDTRDLTTACVDALLASRLPGGTELEVVVVDDGSRDGTSEALSGREGVRVLRNEAPTGYSRAVNRGAAIATGDVLVLLNSDTVVAADGLASVLAAFDAEERLGVAGAALTYPDGSPQWSGGREPTTTWFLVQSSGVGAILGRLPGWRRVKPLHPAGPVEVGWVSGAAVAVRASVWRELGPFETSYRFYGQDLEFCLRARDHGWRVRLLPRFRVVHHHGATVSSKGESIVGGADLGLLWDDLVLWAERRRGAAFARRARATIRAGSGLRLLLRHLALPFVSAARRGDWRRETNALARARLGVTQLGVRS